MYKAKPLHPHICCKSGTAVEHLRNTLGLPPLLFLTCTLSHKNRIAETNSQEGTSACQQCLWGLSGLRGLEFCATIPTHPSDSVEPFRQLHRRHAGYILPAYEVSRIDACNKRINRSDELPIVDTN